MEAIPIHLPAKGVFQTIGELTEFAERGWVVRSEDGTFPVQRAASCLLDPQLGDTVLVAGRQVGSLFVLAVLERSEGSTSSISAEGDLRIELRSGRFTVAATEGVDLVSATEVSLVSDRIEARAREGVFAIGTVRAVGTALDAVYDRLSQKVQIAFRRVVKLDRLRAGQIDYAADEMVRIHSENTVVTSEGLVKMDGKQVHIG
jgi:hypothetical protein